MPDLIMGFDYGTQKIGIAVGQQITGTASPVGIIRSRNNKPDWQAITSLIQEWQPSRLVVGLPLNMDDSASEMSALAEKFARQLEGRYHLPTATMDERLSTFEARQSTRSDEDLDDIAAVIILESWLNQTRGA